MATYITAFFPTLFFTFIYIYVKFWFSNEFQSLSFISCIASITDMFAIIFCAHISFPYSEHEIFLSINCIHSGNYIETLLEGDGSTDRVTPSTRVHEFPRLVTQLFFSLTGKKKSLTYDLVVLIINTKQMTRWIIYQRVKLLRHKILKLRGLLTI